MRKAPQPRGRTGEDKPSYEELERLVSLLKKKVRKLAEANERLRESEEKFETIFENASDHIVYIGVDGTVIDINRAFEDILGYRREEVIGKKFYEFEALSPQDWQKCIDVANALITGRETGDPAFEFEATARDGSKIFIEVKPRAGRSAWTRKAAGTMREWRSRTSAPASSSAAA